MFGAAKADEKWFRLYRTYSTESFLIPLGLNSPSLAAIKLLKQAVPQEKVP
jgi:hypothetical protein